MLKDSYPLYIGNEARRPNSNLVVEDKYSGEIATKVPLASPGMIDEAIGLACEAAKPMAEMPSYRRQEVLNHCVEGFRERFEELAMALCVEAGKPIKDARGEVTRLIDTFRCAAEEAVRFYGEVIPMDISERAEGYFGMYKRVPLGPLSFITPFNFPLNLVAHKIAPALAVGCPFVLKPASLTPVGALVIGEILAETGLPEGAFSILPCSRDGADLFTTDERLKMLSFTGSQDVGWKLKSKAGKKKVALELGGNAAAIVDEDADIADAAKRIMIGGYYQSGQSCVSVQRVVVHEKVYDEFRTTLSNMAANLRMGDPKSDDVFIGPIISEKEAKRIESWVDEAVEKGARLIVGGKRDGVMYEATLMENVPTNVDLYRREVFGPVVILDKVSSFEQALERVNDSDYGLQAGVFTCDIFKAHKAWDSLEVGSVLVNEMPSWRVDHMPYGGVKESGLGREGIRFSMEEMSEIRLFVLRR